MHPFDSDISLVREGPLRFRGNVSGNWSVNGSPNGGYLMAMVAHAMSMAGERKWTPIITAHYISRSVPGDVELRVEEIARTSQFTRLQAGLFQHGREKIRALGTFADEKYECFIVRYETGPPDVPPRDECVPVPELPDFSLLGNLDMRLDPACTGWMQGKLAEKSEHRGWVAFRDERPLDVTSIFLIADAFPPPVFASLGMIAWVPTIELSVNVRNVPATKWVKCVFRTRFINCGLCEEDGEIWDEAGALVAISRQIAQFRQTGA